MVRYGATAGFVGRGIQGIIANNMFTIEPNENIDKAYIYTFLKMEKIYELLNKSNGSSAMPALNFGVVSDVNIIYPQIDEQIRICNFFNNLDTLITLHQCKNFCLIYQT
jgi:type I restriction enzyme S subunit